MAVTNPDNYIIAYADEFPWMRCTCGWMLNMDMELRCPGCKRTKFDISHRDRFSRDMTNPTEKQGIFYYATTEYEDKNRMVF